LLRWLKRLLLLAGISGSIYLALVFGYPLYQYAMMYQAFDDAVDGAVARVRSVQERTEIDVTSEVVDGVHFFLARRARELHLPPDALHIEARVWAGRLVVLVAWEAAVDLQYTTQVLTFSMKEERELSATSIF
jgi:hypothetical protein